MKFIEKYWAALFLVVNIMQQVISLSSYATSPFYLLLGFGVLIILQNSGNLFSRHTMEAHKYLYTFALLTVLYQISFGFIHTNDKSITYLFAKVCSSFCIINSIVKYPEAYSRKLTFMLTTFIAVLLFLGIRQGVDLEAKSALGFGNPNDMGGMAAVCGSIMFISSEKLNWKRWAVTLICFYGALVSGSRSAIAIVFIGLFMKYGFKWKTFSIMFIVFSMLLILSKSGVHVYGIERITETIESGDYDDTRHEERQATTMMIEENPITGNGLYAQNTGAAATISELGSHNGYLDIWKMYGLPFGSIIIIALLSDIRKIWKRYWKDMNMGNRSIFYAAITIPLASMYEAYLWGVNQMTTTLFMICLTILCNNIDREKRYGEEIRIS